MKKSLQANYRIIPAREYKTTAPVPAAIALEVEKPFVTLSTITWNAIDYQRRDSGLSAAEWITRLVQKAK